jgi:lantibiotic modifying enzyme
MAWALLELAGATGDERFREAALEVIRYERTLYAPEAENWLDLREWVAGDGGAAAPGVCATFWCHGAPGIGLARLRSLRHLDDPAVREEIGAAVRTTLATGFGHNHSLCHGDLGNLELLLEAERAGLAPEGTAARVTARIAAHIEAEGWRCGNPMGVESPGLLTGLAGIGYGLLRAAAPGEVPSVLALEAPAWRGED